MYDYVHEVLFANRNWEIESVDLLISNYYDAAFLHILFFINFHDDYSMELLQVCYSG
jgi:hypothetical protein